MLKVEFSEGTIDGITVYVDIADTIDTAKTKIEGQTGIPKASQRILFGGRPIADDRTAENIANTCGWVGGWIGIVTCDIIPSGKVPSVRVREVVGASV